MGKTNRSQPARDWRTALAQLRSDLPAVANPPPFDFTKDHEWERAARFATEVLRAKPGAQFPPDASGQSRSALAFALQWATANSVPGLTPVCDALIRIGGTVARKPGVERAIRFASSYLLKFGDRGVIEEFICQDYGSIHAATAFLTELDEPTMKRLCVPLLQKLQRDISPAVAAKIVERISCVDASACANALNALPDNRRTVVWRAVTKRTQRHLRDESGVKLLGIPFIDRNEIGSRASVLSLAEVERLSPNGVELAMLQWLAKKGDDDVRKLASDKLRAHFERGRQPARPTRQVDTRQPLHRLASSWRVEDRRFAVEEAPLVARSIPLFCTLVLDRDTAIATRALEYLAQLSPALGREHAVNNPRLVSPRALRWLAVGATTSELAAILESQRRAHKDLPVDLVLTLLAAGFDPSMLAEHLAQEENGGGLGVIAAFHVHRGDAAALMRVAELAASAVPIADRHDVVRTALSHSFRAWRHANNVGAALSSLTSALAETDYRTAYKHSLSVLSELNTALSFPRIRSLRDALRDAASLGLRQLPSLTIGTNVDGFVIERGDDFVARTEAWIVDNFAAVEGEAALRVGAIENGRCTLASNRNEGVLDVHGYLPWGNPPARLDELTEALGEPQQDRLRDYVHLMRHVTSITRDMSATEFAWALARTSTHDADYLEKELSRLALWVHSLKNSLRAFAETDRPSVAIHTAVDRYRREAERLLGVFGFHENSGDECFDVRLLCDEVIANHRPSAQRRSIKLSTSIQRDLIVEGPARHLDRILSNLVANAVDAVPHRGNVAIEAEIDRGRFELTIEVCDDGPGLPADLREDVFMISRTKSDGAHFGMGLFEARQLALEVGGTVSLESRAGGGTVARVTVPIDLGDEQ